MLYIWNADLKKKVHKKGLLFFFVYLKKRDLSFRTINK